MAYIKQDWTTGDKITAEKLNHMEDGISNALTEVDASELVDSNSLIKAENNKLDVNMNKLPLALAGDHLDVGEGGKLRVNTDSLSIPTILSEETQYGNYVIITGSSISLHEDVPTLEYMENYIAGQTDIDYSVGYDYNNTKQLYFINDEGHSSLVRNILYTIYESEVWRGMMEGDYGPISVPVMFKDPHSENLYYTNDEQTDVIYNTEIVYHDTDGFYTVNSIGEKQYITV